MPAPVEHTVVVAENIVIFVGVRPPSVPMVERLDRQLFETGKAHPKGLGYIHGLHPKSLDPVRNGLDERARKALLATLRNHVDRVHASLYIVSVGGMLGATMRMFVAGFLLAARTGGPFKVVGHVDEGLEWLTTKLRAEGADVPADGVIRAALAQAHRDLGI